MGLDRFFKACADQSRLRILNLLLDHPHCVCELQQVLGLPQALLSRHLAYLRAAGLVRDKRVGSRVQYLLATDHPLVEIFMPCLRQALLEEEIYREDLRRHAELGQSCCTVTPRPAAAAANEFRGGQQTP
ncbi:MAG: ArsR/SmtB family transcription factor [Bryobacteraceae bacterium]